MTHFHQIVILFRDHCADLAQKGRRIMRMKEMQIRGKHIFSLVIYVCVSGSLEIAPRENSICQARINIDMREGAGEVLI